MKCFLGLHANPCGRVDLMPWASGPYTKHSHQKCELGFTISQTVVLGGFESQCCLVGTVLGSKSFKTTVLMASSPLFFSWSWSAYDFRRVIAVAVAAGRGVSGARNEDCSRGPRQRSRGSRDRSRSLVIGCGRSNSSPCRPRIGTGGKCPVLVGFLLLGDPETRARNFQKGL